MTLVIPSYYTEHTRKSCNPTAAYPSLTATRTIATMPCGFDGEPMDFETVSASFDPGCCWPTLDDITEYRSFSGSGQTSISAASKRKDDEDGDNNDDESDAKKFRIEVATDESSDNASDCDDSTTSSSSSDSSSGCPDGADDLFCPPRRRGPLLWSPKLRWKDERRKVLKISLAKIRIIEDPEVFLRRSVLINNTLKRLQREINEEKSSRYRDPYLSYPLSAGGDDASSSSSSSSSQDGVARCWGFECQPEDPFPGKGPRHIDSSSSSSSSPSSSASPPSSQSLSEVPPTCDEIFGVNEDMLRINMPPQKTREGGPTSSEPSSSPPPQQRGSHSPSSSSASSTHLQSSSYVGELTCSCRSMNSSRSSCGSKRPNPDPVSRHFDLNAMGHCATQYRTVHEHGEGLQGGSILDSVVYHSLLASLES